jgi:chaperonin GroES
MLRVLADRVAVKPIEESATTKGGIIIPIGSKHLTPTMGEVTLVGPDCGDVQVGQEVLFVQNAGQLVKIDGEDIRVIRENEIYGIC